MAKNSARRQSAIDSIAKLEKKRKRDIWKCVISLVVILALLFGRLFLGSLGVDTDSAFVGGLMMMASLCLCIFAGMASMDATKCRNTIKGIMASNNLTKEKLKALREETV